MFNKLSNFLLIVRVDCFILFHSNEINPTSKFRGDVAEEVGAVIRALRSGRYRSIAMWDLKVIITFQKLLIFWCWPCFLSYVLLLSFYCIFYHEHFLCYLWCQCRDASITIVHLLLYEQNVVGRNHKPFQGCDQHDSHEFLLKLLDWLSEDLNEVLYPFSLLHPCQICTSFCDYILYCFWQLGYNLLFSLRLWLC